jgi:hypothetical protein
MSKDSTAIRAAKLRKSIQLLSSAAETLISEWEKTSADNGSEASPMLGFRLPSHAEHEAEQTVKAALGTIEEVSCSPEIRLLEVGIAHFDSRALYIAAKHNIPHLLQVNGEKGVHVDDLAVSTGIEKRKLSRLYRSITLCITLIAVYRNLSPHPTTLSFRAHIPRGQAKLLCQ